MSDHNKLRDELADRYSYLPPSCYEGVPMEPPGNNEDEYHAFKAGFDAGYKARDEESKSKTQDTILQSLDHAAGAHELMKHSATEFQKEINLLNARVSTVDKLNIENIRLRDALEKTHQKAHIAFKLIDRGDSISAADELESIIDDAQEALKDTGSDGEKR